MNESKSMTHTGNRPIIKNAGRIFNQSSGLGMGAAFRKESLSSVRIRGLNIRRRRHFLESQQVSSPLAFFLTGLGHNRVCGDFKW